MMNPEVQCILDSPNALRLEHVQLEKVKNLAIFPILVRKVENFASNETSNSTEFAVLRFDSLSRWTSKIDLNMSRIYIYVFDFGHYAFNCFEQM